MLWETPFTWSFKDFENIFSEFFVFFLYSMMWFKSNFQNEIYHFKYQNIFDPGDFIHNRGLGANLENKMCNFYNFLARSGIISRMVYMDSDFVGFCIRNAIGGARDEVWQDATLWFMGLQLRIQVWGFDWKINIWDVKIMCIRQFQIKVQVYFYNQKI